MPYALTCGAATSKFSPSERRLRAMRSSFSRPHFRLEITCRNSSTAPRWRESPLNARSDLASSYQEFRVSRDQHQVDWLGRYNHNVGPRRSRHARALMDSITTIGARWYFGGYGRFAVIWSHGHSSTRLLLRTTCQGRLCRGRWGMSFRTGRLAVFAAIIVFLGLELFGWPANPGRSAAELKTWLNAAAFCRFDAGSGGTVHFRGLLELPARGRSAHAARRTQPVSRGRCDRARRARKLLGQPRVEGSVFF